MAEGISLSISKQTPTKGIDPNSSSNQGIDWDKIIPKIEPYSLTTRKDNFNYDKISNQLTNQTINIQDILQSNQYQGQSSLENRTHTPLALPTPLTQPTIPGYQGNSQGPYKIGMAA